MNDLDVATLLQHAELWTVLLDEVHRSHSLKWNAQSRLT